MAKYSEVSSSGGFKVVNSVTDDLIDGNRYGIFHEQLDYQSNQTFGLFFETLDNDLLIKISGNFFCGTDSIVLLYEGITINPGAIPTTERVAPNINRLYPNALANVKSISAVPTIGAFSLTDTTETSPVAAIDHLLAYLPFGGNRVRASANDLPEIILNKNTIYGLEFTAGGLGGTAELAIMQLVWSEITMSTDDELESLSFLEDVRQRILRVRNIVV